MSMPVFGYLYDRTVSHAGDAEASLSTAGLVQAKIEPEIVFKLRERPPATRDPVALLASVEWLAQGFELVQSHYPDWVFAAPDAIADSGFHARYVVGRPTVIEPGDGAGLVAALADFRIELLLDGEVAAEGGGATVLGSPLQRARLPDRGAGRPARPSAARRRRADHDGHAHRGPAGRRRSGLDDAHLRAAGRARDAPADLTRSPAATGPPRPARCRRARRGRAPRAARRRRPRRRRR